MSGPGGVFHRTFYLNDLHFTSEAWVEVRADFGHPLGVVAENGTLMKNENPVANGLFRFETSASQSPARMCVG